MRVKSSRRNLETQNQDEEVKRALRGEFLRGFRCDCEATHIADDFIREQSRWVAVADIFEEAVFPGGAPGYLWELLQTRKQWSDALENWCKTFPRQLTRFAASLCEMGYDAGSIGRQLDEVCLAVRNAEVEHWLSLTLLHISEWGAPGWMLDWPSDVNLISLITETGRRLDKDETRDLTERVTNGELWNSYIPVTGVRLDKDETRNVIEQVRNYAGKRIVLAKEEVMDSVIISCAKRDLALNGARAFHHGRKVSIIQEAMELHPDLSYREICGRVDDRCQTASKQIPVPRKCKRHSHKTLVESLDCVACRKYMKSFLSIERASLGLPRPPKSEFPPKTKVAKLVEVKN